MSELPRVLQYNVNRRRFFAPIVLGVIVGQTSILRPDRYLEWKAREINCPSVSGPADSECKAKRDRESGA